MIASDDKFTMFPASRDFAQPKISNTKTNIISGPNTKPWVPGQMYWDHSPGPLAPMEREEGPLPIPR